jgi:UV DNA damage repair endonuclease
MHPDRSLDKAELKKIESQYSERATTAAWLARQPSSVAEQRVESIIRDNLHAAHRLVKYVSQLPANRRMVRLGSNIIPMATHPEWRYIAESQAMQQLQQQEFARIGELARDSDVRLSFHPGQFVVLASDKPDVVDRSIDEFEYHVNMARMMGYGKTFQDFKCNVHISGRRGAQGIIDIMGRLSPEARNILTIENDEFSWGIDESIKLKSHCALVLDIHHHLIHDHEYVWPTDDRFRQVIESWRSVRPVIHYSYSRCEHIPDVANKHQELHDMNQLLEAGGKRTKLRAHSDYYPNLVANEWALSFLPHADIMCEAKMKGLASQQVYEQAQALNII